MQNKKVPTCFLLYRFSVYYVYIKHIYSLCTYYYRYYRLSIARAYSACSMDAATLSEVTD